MRCALYARVSTFDQEPENQLQERADPARGRARDRAAVRSPTTGRAMGGGGTVAHRERRRAISLDLDDAR